jgi:hypothetical protein
MPIFIVTKNDTPCHATFNEQEAQHLFESTVRSGRYRQVAVVMVPSSTNLRVLMEAAQAPEAA